MISIWMILKVFSDACVCFAILGAFPYIFPCSYSLVWPALLCGIGAGVSSWLYESGKRKFYYLGILIPAASLLFADGIRGMLILVPVVGYTSVIIFRAQFHLEYYAYRHYFKQNLFLLAGLYILFSMVSYIESLTTVNAATIDSLATFRYLLVYAATGVVLQRQLRMGMVNQSQGRFMDRAQIVVVLSGTGAVIFGVLTAEPMLRKWASNVFNSAINIFVGIFLFLYDCGMWLIDAMKINVMYEQIQEQKGNDSVSAMGPAVQEVIQQTQQVQEDSKSYWWIVLVLILLVIVMLQMLKTFRKQSVETSSTEQIAKVAVNEVPKSQSKRTNRGKVRHYYREFLRLERKRGMNPKKNYTTEDILQRISKSTNVEAATELRNVYLRARYDESCEITREQADAAKAALKKIRT